MSWIVVQFTRKEDDSVEAVPLSWLNSKRNCCFWPPYRSPNRIRTAIINREEPTNQWTSHAVRPITNGLCRSYEESQKKLKEAQYKPDTGNSDLENSKKSYKRTFTNRMSSSDEDQMRGAKKDSRLPKPPAFENKVTSDKRTDEDDEVDENDDKDDDLDISLEEDDVFEEDERKSEEEERKKCCCQEVKKELMEMKEMMSALIEKTVLIKTSQAELSSQISGVGIMGSGGEEQKTLINILGALPAKTKMELVPLEEYLKEHENLLCAATYFSHVGGDSLYEFVKRILTRLLTDDVGILFNMKGRGEKSSFLNESSINKLIIASMKLSSLKNNTEKDTESCVGKWLRRCKERINNKNKE